MEKNRGLVAKAGNIGKKSPVAGNMDYVKYLSMQKVNQHCQSSQNEPLHDKTNIMTVRPAKTQISLAIPPVYQSLRCVLKGS